MNITSLKPKEEKELIKEIDFLKKSIVYVKWLDELLPKRDSLNTLRKEAQVHIDKLKPQMDEFDARLNEIKKEQEEFKAKKEEQNGDKEKIQELKDEIAKIFA